MGIHKGKSCRFNVCFQVLFACSALLGAAVSVSSTISAEATAAGGPHTCALLDNGDLKCWGWNESGELGKGDTNNRGDEAGEMGDSLSAITLGTGRSAVAITAGWFHSCALLDNGDVKCCGRNYYGELGQGDTEYRGDDAGEMGDSLSAVKLGTGRSAVAITASEGHTCALLDNGDVKCWGHNYSGELGQGDTEDRGDEAGEMGDSLSAVDLGTGRSAVAITAGAGHTCALLDNGDLKCWGSNSAGELGQGDTEVRGDEAGKMGDSLSAIGLGTGRSASAITASSGYTCALLDNGDVKCWGHNYFGELGKGDTENRGDEAGEMGDSLSAINLGSGRSAVAITAGISHTCAPARQWRPQMLGQ